ncbi:uncharacterized protein BCR38DRAFT_167214 [Pseudomassariella vexata]|uniref:Uncharacterized protein n=1 Tax=Pseudomassariella vexata TaxID=1141098 RepID=A0A1Y2E2R4_9PEZI|nr:uncharacterized protein BCR38DRAFT_167214 [Pseudomassariella vexata]ORY65838.1 hypothetical protein BCR38DRAFT_167214 [Pseudomassariella vexata]
MLTLRVVLHKFVLARNCPTTDHNCCGAYDRSSSFSCHSLSPVMRMPSSCALEVELPSIRRRIENFQCSGCPLRAYSDSVDQPDGAFMSAIGSSSHEPVTTNSSVPDRPIGSQDTGWETREPASLVPRRSGQHCRPFSPNVAQCQVARGWRMCGCECVCVGENDGPVKAGKPDRIGSWKVGGNGATGTPCMDYVLPNSTVEFRGSRVVFA